MKNLDKLLSELTKQGSISPPVKLFLQRFFEDMHLKEDIGEKEVSSLPREMASPDFSTVCDTDFLSGDFERLAPALLAEGAFASVIDGNISAVDLDKIIFIFCRVHDATEKTN